MPKRLFGSTDSGVFSLDVARGIYPRASWVDKFGNALGIDTGMGYRPIWDGAAAQTDYKYPEWGTAPITHIVSDNAADAGIETIVSGNDITGAEVNQDVILNGLTPVELDTPLWRCWRLLNDNFDMGTGLGQTYLGNIVVMKGTAVTAGVPDDVDDVMAKATAMDPDSAVSATNPHNNQTQMAIYTIPLGVWGYLMEGETGVSKSGGVSAAVAMCYRSRRVGGIFTVKKRFSVSSTSSHFKDERQVWDPIPPLTDIEVGVIETSANDTGVWAAFDILLETEDSES